MLETTFTPGFWISLLQIIGIDIVLSGDNAVVIALAARSLHPAEQKKAVFFGSLGAIILRVILIFFAVLLLELPYLKLVGGILLLGIGIRLLLPEDKDYVTRPPKENLMAAIKTIILADFVMSLDNVVGIAAAAKGNTLLLALGLLISIPLIMYGSTVILKLMQRFPIIITLGAALLGYVAGEMAVTDGAIVGWVEAQGRALHYVAPIACALLVVTAGKILAARMHRKQAEFVDLARSDEQPLHKNSGG